MSTSSDLIYFALLTLAMGGVAEGATILLDLLVNLSERHLRQK